MPARPARPTLPLLDAPLLVEFLVAELRDHLARVEQDTQGSVLAGPRLNLLRQAVHELEEARTGGDST